MGLAPLMGLSAERLAELATMVELERVKRGTDVLAERAAERRSLFLISGEMLFAFAKGGTLVVVGGSEEARAAINRRTPAVARSRAITDVDVIAIDDEVLDILATWDELAAVSAVGETGPEPGSPGTDWRLLSGMFSISSLRSGVFAQLPAAHIDTLLKRFERIPVRRGEVVIREGGDGDYYYVIESGRFRVERVVGGVTMELAELKSGDAFGEEALVSEAKRNATVIARGDAQLLRLAKSDFNELLREPLMRRLAWDEACARVAAGAVWLDVRYPSEYQYDKLPGAINVPLAEVRNTFASMDRSREYIVYCQSGRRSAAACFLYAQRAFHVSMLDGGLWAAAGRR
ncbi:MAG: cyclic nucleotide-binding domain-containing protein [Betaproteobacteria bacterium]|nr:cyclic nucleotide-binding domain-containing protein [Betaproteobacteria bacterium]